MVKMYVVKNILIIVLFVNFSIVSVSDLKLNVVVNCFWGIILYGRYMV